MPRHMGGGREPKALGQTPADFPNPELVLWTSVLAYPVSDRVSEACACFQAGSALFLSLLLLHTSSYLELVDCAFRVAYVPYATSMPGLCCSYGCFSGLHYVMLLWFELCDCLCMPSRYIYARFHDISMGHYTWIVVTCNDLSLSPSSPIHTCLRTFTCCSLAGINVRSARRLTFVMMLSWMRHSLVDYALHQQCAAHPSGSCGAEQHCHLYSASNSLLLA
jgi:hypothetical protein